MLDPPDSLSLSFTIDNTTRTGKEKGDDGLMKYVTEAGVTLGGYHIGSSTTLRTNLHLLEEVRVAAEAAAAADEDEEDGSLLSSLSNYLRRRLNHRNRGDYSSSYGQIPASTNGVIELSQTFTSYGAISSSSSDFCRTGGVISQLCALGGFGRIHLDLRLSDTAGAFPYSADVTLQHTVLSGFDVLTTPWTINIRGGLDMNHQVTRTRLEYDNDECTGTPTITHAPGMRYPNGTGFAGSPSWFSSALQHSRDVNGNMEPYPYGGICRNYGTSSQWEFCDLNTRGVPS